MKTLRWMVAAASVAMALASCSGDDGGSSSGSDSKFCTAAKAAQDSIDGFGATLGGGSVPDADATKKALEETIKLTKVAVKSAPSSIKDDMQTSIDGFEDFQKVFADNDYDFGKIATDADYTKLAEDKDLQAANDRVQAFLKSECGIGSSGTTDSAATTTSVSGDVTDTTVADTTAATAVSGKVTQAQIDAVKQYLPKLDDDQIRCLLEKGMGAAGGAPDPNTMADCKIDIADIVP